MAKEKSRKKLFTVAALFHADSGTEIILEPKNILAADQKTAGMMASRMIDEKYVSDFEDVDIIVRPF